MATIRKRTAKYEVQVRRKGFPTTTKSFLRVSDAREWARLVEGQADRQELTPDRKSLSLLTLADLVIRYRHTVLTNNKSGHIETIMLDAFLRHPICKRPLSVLSPVDFASWRDERLSPVDGARAITPKSVKRLLSPLQHMFEVAITEWGIPLRENPLARFRLRVADNKRHRRLRAGEFERIVSAIERTKNRYILPLVKFALETGMRRGELLFMQWNHLDVDKRSLVIPEAKNGYSRTIPLSKEAIAVVQALEGQGAFVFPTSPNAVLLAWNRITKRAGIEDLHFHDLRHEAISRFFEKGLTVPEVASISGHRDIRMLMRYAHADKTRLFEKLDNEKS